MNYATRGAGIHDRCAAKFGVNADGEQLYVWHSGTQVAAYQPSGMRTRDILAMSLTRDETITVHATKSTFTAVPVPGDIIHFGTALATARRLRCTDVKTTHVRPFYELSLVDPNTATTAS